MRLRLCFNGLLKEADNILALVGATPKGLLLSAQGCCTRLPWVMEPGWRDVGVDCNPEGVAAYGSRYTPCHVPSRIARPQPRCGWHALRLISQGSRVRQPWAVSRNPVGIAVRCPDSSPRTAMQTLHRSPNNPAFPQYADRVAPSIAPDASTPRIRIRDITRERLSSRAPICEILEAPDVR
jgi:hypothetical protein